MRDTDKFDEKEGSPLSPDTHQTKDLKTSENIALWSIRTWVWSVALQKQTGPLLKSGLEKAGCADAASPLSALLHIVGETATRDLEIHKSGCPSLSADEKRLLHTLAAQQNGHILEAFDVLVNLLPGAAVRLALTQAEAVSASFARAGLFFPERAWTLEELSLTHRLRAPRTTRTCVRYMLH